MNIFENNLKLLRTKNKSLADRIEHRTELSSQFALEESKSGDANLSKNGVFLHSTLDPEQEAINLLKEINYNYEDCFHYIYGLGLGYVLKRFNKKLKGYIIVYEPDIDVLRLTLEMVDFSDELTNEKVLVFDNFADIDKFYEKKFFGATQITTSICDTYKDFDLKNAQEFIKHMGYIHGIYTSNHKTYWEKHHKWVSSLTDNLEYLPKYNEVKVLKDKFKNKPALIISAGPSLNKNIELVKKYQNNFVIFCVGTALKTVLNHGIVPDFICFVEFHHVTTKMMAAGDGKNSNLIIQPITYKGIFESAAKNKFLFYADNDEAATWAAKKFGIEQDDYINRGTVSINALVSAKIAGCNPIVLVGQDLAYTNNQCYATGAVYDDFKVVDNKVVVDNVSDALNKAKIREVTLNRRLEFLTSQLYKVKGQNGEDLVSPGDYASFIEYFEQLAKIYEKDTELFNATEGGAQINGYTNITFAEVTDKYANKEIDKTLDNIQTPPIKNQGIIKEEIKKAIRLFEEKYKQIFIKGQKLASSIDISEDCYNSHELYRDKYVDLLKCYRELRLLPQSDLLDLFMSRNIFKIDYYLSHIKDDINKHYLMYNLYYLFKFEYNDFLLKQIEKLKEIEIN